MDFQGMLDAFPFYVMLIDETHHIIYANKAVSKTFGVDPAGLVGAYCPKTIHKMDSPYPGCPLEESVEKHAGGIVEREFYDATTDGWMMSAVYPTTYRTNDGKRIFLHTARALQFSEIEMRKNYDIVNVLNAMLNLQIRDVPLEDILQYTLDNVLGIPWLSLESRGGIFVVEDAPNILILKAQNGLAEPICAACATVPFGKCLCGRAAASGAAEFADCVDERHEVTFEGMANHGHYCIPILSSSSKVLGVINTYLKVGHKREPREEDFLKTIANGLAGIIEHKNIEKQKRLLQTQLIHTEKMAALGHMAGGVAHEINNPMGVILGFAQLVSRDIKEDDTLYLPLKSIEREALRCKKLVSDLLLFSRAGKSSNETVNINETIETTLSLIEAQAKVNNVRVCRNFDPDDLSLRANKNQLQEIIVNMCNNAIDAMPAGGIITIATRHTDTNIIIDITNTGQGIPVEARPHIFEPFFTTKEVGKGTGLGLSLCYEIVKKHQGTITFVSEQGKGTTFTITLPRN